MSNYLKETPILNYADSSIQSLVKSKNWLALDTTERVKSIYNYVLPEYFSELTGDMRHQFNMSIP
jgi:hypothetical protein